MTKERPPAEVLVSIGREMREKVAVEGLAHGVYHNQGLLMGCGQRNLPTEARAKNAAREAGEEAASQRARKNQLAEEGTPSTDPWVVVVGVGALGMALVVLE
jgi:hypothetical protein